MKILEISGIVPYVARKYYNPVHYMVWYISKKLKSVLSDDEVYMVSEDYLSQGRYDDVTVVNFRRIFVNFLRQRYPELQLDRLSYFLSTHQKEVKDVYSGTISYIIRKTKPDVVHFHDPNGINELIFEDVMKANIPILFTLYRLVGYSVKNSQNKIYMVQTKEFDREKEILKEIAKREYYITVPSGYYKTVLSKLYDVPADIIKIIHPGVLKENFRPSIDDRSILRKIYGIPQNSIALLTNDAFSGFRNTLMILKSLSIIKYLDPKLYEYIFYIMIGRGKIIRKVVYFIRRHGLEQNVKIVTELMSPQQLIDIFHAADFYVDSTPVLIASSDYIYSMLSGLPIITAASNIQNESIFYEKGYKVVKNYDPQELANAILETIGKSWEREDIKEFALKFTIDSSIHSYVQLIESYR